MSASDQKFGLNKEKRLAAERAVQQEDISSLILVPDFPYDTQSFDPGFFGLFEAPSPGDGVGSGQ